MIKQNDFIPIKNDILKSDVKSKEEDSEKNNNAFKQILFEKNNFFPENLILSSEIPMPLFFQFLDLKSLDRKILFSKKYIFYSFNSQKMTKYLQKCLIQASKEIISFIIDELNGSFREVIKNKNGNYFCSNLIKICTQNNRIKILKELSNTISEDCIHEFGNYPIQNLIYYASSIYEFELLLLSFNEYEKVLIPAINPHGTFVIQKLIKHIPEEIRMKLNSLLLQFVSLLARDTYGVYVLKNFISYLKNEEIQKQILDSISNDFINISTNKNGNYLIQNLLKNWWGNKKGEHLKKLIKSKYTILCNNIYAIHICELYDKLNNNEENKSDSNFNVSKNY